MKFFGRPLRFSLLSLLLFHVFVGAMIMTGMYFNEPWYRSGSSGFVEDAEEVAQSWYSVFEISPDGSAIARISSREHKGKWYSRFEFMDTKTGRVARSETTTDEDLALRFSPQDASIIMMTKNRVVNGGALYTRNLRTNKTLLCLETPTPNLMFHSGEFSPDGKHIAAYLEYLRLWDLNGKLLGEAPKAYPRNNLAFSDDGKLIATAYESTLFLLDGNTLMPISEFKTGSERNLEVQQAKFIPGDNNHLVLRSSKGVVKFDLKTGKNIWEYEFEIESPFSDGPGKFFDISPSGDRVVLSRTPQGTLILDAKNGAVLMAMPNESGFGLSRFGKNGNLWIVADANMTRWSRRFPEWWWGHFYRPEVWIAIVFGILWLVQVVKWWTGTKRKGSIES